MEHKDIKDKHDKAYQYCQTTRKEGSDDLIFAWITQWDDDSLEESQLSYRGEFNILRKATRGIISDLAANPVQVDFQPVDEDRDDAADLLDGLYRADCQNNTSLEAFSNAEQEVVICGMGAWELYTEYKSIRSDDNKQVIRRRPIPEANNTVFWDPNAKLLDKSDASYVSILTAYSEDGYKALVESLTGEEEDDISPESFKSPEQSYVFSWVGLGSAPTYYISTFYHREIIKTKLLTLTNPVGQEVKFYESELDGIMNEMIDSGFEIINEKEINKWQVKKYIVSGKEILNGEEDADGERQGDIIAGEYIPVITAYGERAIIEGEEHWEGVTRLAKDPQRLHNFQMSYLADIVSKSPRVKPIFFQEQVAGHEDMYAVTGAENNYAYMIQNRLADDGQPLPVGPVGIMPEQPMPQALVASIQLSRESVGDVANPGISTNIADVDLSNKAVLSLQNKIDQQSMVYQEHIKHAKRHDGIVYASIAAEIVDTPRTVSVMLPDGTRTKKKVMDQKLDSETGEVVTLNDINNVEFEVFSTIGPSYNSQKAQTLDRLEKMTQTMSPDSPMHRILTLKYLRLMDGTDFDDVREYANRELIIDGVKKPETDEEIEMLANAQKQQQEPTPEMLIGLAERDKGQAALLEQKRKGIEMQLNFQTKDTANEIQGFNAQTKRMDTQVDAAVAEVSINTTKIEDFGKQLDNEVKIKELLQPIDMSDDELMAEFNGA